MNERVVLITGGARGLGRALATALAHSGWRVAICYRTSANEAHAWLAAMRAHNVECRAERCDVSEAHAAQAWVQQVARDWGRIDALLNCAGTYHRMAYMQETAAGWRESFDNNLHPVFYLSQAVAPFMRARQWGRIINFSIAQAEQLLGQPFITAHYIAKVGVLALTRTLAKVLAGDGITVNCIAPGYIAAGNISEEERANLANKIPAGFVGASDDIIATCEFLLSERARYVNGANITVSGAWGV